MHPHELRPLLTRLKLSGMLDTLDIRRHEAETDRLSYVEFLQRLCADEIERRDQHAVARRVAAPRFDQVQTLTAFDFHYNPQIPAATIRELATGGFLRRHESIILAGPVGVGKSHLAQALGHAMCRQGHAVAYRRAPSLLSELAGGHADGTFQRRLRAYFVPDLLIVDDFGLRDFTVAQSEDLYELVSQRDRQKSWIVVSNRLPGDWYGLFPNPVLAEGLLDRLVNTSYHVVLEGRSYRPRRRPGVEPPAETPLPPG